jgi:cytochrome c
MRRWNCPGGEGTFVGPQSDDEGASGHTLKWLLAQFETPDEVAPGTIMPVVQGTDRQLRSLAMYLLSLKMHITPNAALGRKVYAQRNCGYCHGNDGKGSKIGPALIGTRGPVRTALRKQSGVGACDAATEVAAHVPGIVGVNNDLEVMPPV